MGEAAVLPVPQQANELSLRQILASGQPFAELSAREIGTAGERLASSYLERRGFVIIDRNWRCSFGEADIICQLTTDTIVLVEVKTRLERGISDRKTPEIAVGEAKRRRYGNIALCYIRDHPWVESVRFDVIGITLSDESGAHIHHIASAYSWDE